MNLIELDKDYYEAYEQDYLEEQAILEEMAKEHFEEECEKRILAIGGIRNTEMLKRLMADHGE